MGARLGINGFGRIGRTILRAALQSKEFDDLEIVHVNDLTPPATLAHLLRYDSVAGSLGLPVVVEDNHLRVGGRRLSLSAERNPANLAWASRGVDIVLECTGIFRDRAKASLHLEAGAKKVLISAPAQGEDKTVVFGVNSAGITAADKIISNGSCTTNCLALVTQVIHQKYGVESGLMNTVHSYTNDQMLLDLAHRPSAGAGCCFEYHSHLHRGSLSHWLGYSRA